MPRPHSPRRRIIIAVAIAVPILAVAAAIVMRARGPAPLPPGTVQGSAESEPPVRASAVLGPAPIRDASLPSAPVPPSPVAPSFDVVRVAPGGSTVIAGRAEPGVQVLVREGAQTLGETRADSRGEWVLLPAAPLAPGGRELTLSSRAPGAEEIRGDSVLLSIPAPAQPPGAAAAPPGTPTGPTSASASGASSAVPPARAEVLLLPRAGMPRVLGTPDAAARGGAGLNLGAVDYDDRGEIRFAGTARPGAAVRVYVDDAPAGIAVADPGGRWLLSPRDSLVAGLHRLRVDQVAATGQVQARVEVPFQRTSLAASELAGGRVVVQPGQTLWRLARSAYGTGVRYTVIYLANRDQIRDPKRIYPGQVFAVPEGAAKP